MVFDFSVGILMVRGQKITPFFDRGQLSVLHSSKIGCLASSTKVIIDSLLRLEGSWNSRSLNIGTNRFFMLGMEF